jgi:hypothetical protein
MVHAQRSQRNLRLQRDHLGAIRCARHAAVATGIVVVETHEQREVVDDVNVQLQAANIDATFRVTGSLQLRRKPVGGALM